MAKKYHIAAKAAPPRFTIIGRHGIVDFNEDCAGACHHCVKKECIYDIYKKEGIFTREMQGDLHYLYNCMNCLRCVQNCTRGVVTRIINPEFRWLGDSYWKPEILLSLWYQSETGKIPVSGAGYRGPFSGPGFDAMWTDMSEIVRPTRDGIHGREYISTSVDLGAKVRDLAFDEKGHICIDVPPVHELPVPFVLANPHFGDFSPQVYEAAARAAHEMGTLYVIDPALVTANLKPYQAALAPAVTGATIARNSELIRGAKLVQLDFDEQFSAGVAAIKALSPTTVVSVKVPIDADSPSLAERLVLAGVESITFVANHHGRSGAFGSGEFLKESFRRIHTHLVELGLRDLVTLIASGGIAQAEHMAKIIICGADMVVLDIPFLIALECRMCMNCTKGRPCPVDIAHAPVEFGARRMTNLGSSWHSQLLEVLGAMGIREVRRLRGEYGRAMFYEDLERETFQALFAGGKASKS
jgi:glutamate synthase domain-containing protein 2